MSPKNNPLFQKFEKCANYSVLTTLIAGTVRNMLRFKNVSDEKLLPTIFSKLKLRANASR